MPHNLCSNLELSHVSYIALAIYASEMLLIGEHFVHILLRNLFWSAADIIQNAIRENVRTIIRISYYFSVRRKI
jgi:hypothetical protein